MSIAYGFSHLKQGGYAILQNINNIGGLVGIYRLAKPSLSSNERKDLKQLEDALSPIFNPLQNVRNMFAQWNAQCDLELSHYKRTQQIRNFEREKNGVKKFLEQKKTDYALLSSKMQSALLALEVAERTAIRNDIKTEERIPLGAVEVITVEKGQPFTMFTRLARIFQNARGYVKIMDNWVGEQTLDFIHNFPSQIPVMILTSTIERNTKAKFEAKFDRLIKERGGKVEVRVIKKSEFHDRYVITQDELWHSGPSLKDLGKKLGIVAKIGDMQTKITIEKKFDELWNSSDQFRK